jgi:hypothetical protein
MRFVWGYAASSDDREALASSICPELEKAKVVRTTDVFDSCTRLASRTAEPLRNRKSGHGSLLTSDRARARTFPSSRATRDVFSV